jgi:hypothetical protein
VPDIAPEVTVFSGGFRDSPEWGSSAIIVPWQHYLFTGDDTCSAVLCHDDQLFCVPAKSIGE